MSATKPRRVSLMILLVIAAWIGLPPTASAAAGWIAPLPEPLTVTQAFDPPANPYAAGHRGVDLAGSLGQQVRAAGAGKVVYAGPLAGRGVVSIEHAGGLRTTYEPVSASVSAGLSVSLGQVLGALEPGHPGCPMAACLHWGLKRGEVYLDPLLLLRRGPVRLLPRYGAGAAGNGQAPLPSVTAGPLGVGSAWLVPLVPLVPLAPRRRRALRWRPAQRTEDACRVSDKVVGIVGIKRADGPGDKPP